MFWKKGSISNLMQVKKVIENVKDSSRLKPVIMRYMHEYHGDAAASIHNIEVAKYGLLCAVI